MEKEVASGDVPRRYSTLRSIFSRSKSRSIGGLPSLDSIGSSDSTINLDVSSKSGYLKLDSGMIDLTSCLRVDFFFMLFYMLSDSQC